MFEESVRKELNRMAADRELIEGLEQGITTVLNKYRGSLMLFGEAMKNDKEKIYNMLKENLGIQNSFKEEFFLFYEYYIEPVYLETNYQTSKAADDAKRLKTYIRIMNFGFLWLIFEFLFRAEKNNFIFNITKTSYINFTILYFFLFFIIYKEIKGKTSVSFGWFDKILMFLTGILAFPFVPVFSVIKFLGDIFMVHALKNNSFAKKIGAILNGRV